MSGRGHQNNQALLQKQQQQEGKWEETRPGTQIYKSKTLEWSPGSSQEPGGGLRGGLGDGGEAAQCLSVAPQRGQTRHNGSSVSRPSCTFIGLPDTRPLPFFNNQHNNLFRRRSNGLLLGHWAERDHSVPNGRSLRCFFHPPAATDVLLENGRLPSCCCSPGRGDFFAFNGWKTAGVENTVVHSTRLSAEFSDFRITGWKKFPIEQKKSEE